MEGVADGHVHCWEMGSDHTHSGGRGQEIGQRHVWSPGAGAGAPLSSGSRPGLMSWSCPGMYHHMGGLAHLGGNISKLDISIGHDVLES